MKKVMILVAALVAILVSGCSSKKPGPMLIVETQKNQIAVEGSYDFDKVSPAQNLAIAMKKIAKELKKRNVKYFVLDKKLQVPPMITNFEDMINYCYPENEGFNKDAWTAGSTSLENKCKLKDFNIFGNDIIVKVYVSDKNLGMGTWVVDDILKDKNMNKYIEEAKKAVGKDFYFSKVLITIDLKYLRKGFFNKEKIEKNKYKEDL